MDNYWDKFYKSKYDISINNESSFASFINDYIQPEYKTFIDLACGNGRDLKYFIKNNPNIQCTGLDFSLSTCQQLSTELDGINIINQSVLDPIPPSNSPLSPTSLEGYDIYYCRFLLHSLQIEQIDQFFNNLYKSMHNESILCIETRSTGLNEGGDGGGDGGGGGSGYNVVNHDSGIGHKHERLLLSLKYLQDIYIKNNFICTYVIEDNNLSVYKEDNPYLIRLILKKNDASLSLLKTIVNNGHIRNNLMYKRLFDKLVQIFNDNDIKYCMHYGNLLGLIRHNSLFIPWDDDIDTWMPDESVNKLVELSSKYNFTYEKCSNELHKLRYNGLSIDIFTYDHFNSHYGITDTYFNEYNIINGYKVPIDYKKIFDAFYNFGDYMKDCYIYSHCYNDRWETNNHKKFKLSLKEVEHMLSIMNYNHL